MILADALATALRDWGVDYVFGVSGANIEHLHDAIHRLGDGRLRAVLARSEAGAAFMADARARVHRTLGVCCATSGGGMMNLAVGVAESFAESVPVLALVGQVPTSHEGRGGFQDSSGVGRTVDAVGLWRSIAKFVARVTAPADFWSLLHQAALVALSGRPGPAVLLLPRDLQAAEVPPMPAWFPRELAAMRRPSPIRDQTAVRALLERLRQARRPVLVMGSGVARCSNPGAVARFARDSGVPVVTTIGDPGAFGNDEPRYLGTIGVAGHPSAHRYLNEEADLIVAVGTGLDVMTRAPIAPALARVPVGVVNVDVGPILRVIDPAFVIEADAGAVFEDWLAAVRQRPYTAPLTDSVPATRFRPRLAAPIDPVAGALAPRLRQSEAIEQLQRYLPAAGHVIFDAGNCAATALHFLAIPAGVTSTIALGMGGMGYALAAGTGAQLGSAPGTRTMVLCGDGAFLMLGLEIHCAIELGLPVLFVVFNNQKHGMCVTRQQLYFGGRIAASTYAGVDVAAVARGLGGADALWTGRASTGGELAACLAAYHAEPVSRPGVLELVLPAEEVPPFTPFLPADAETYVVARGPQRVASAATAA
jgi:acetolactate synthase-1/2/3 large subunit